MKTTKRYIKFGSLLLVCIMVLQSCRVYQHHPSTLEEAVTQEKRVKIKTTDGETLKFNKIELVDGKYYGVSKMKRETVKVPLEADGIETLRLHNKTMSIVYGIGIGISVAAFLGLVAVYDAFNHWRQN